MRLSPAHWEIQPCFFVPKSTGKEGRGGAARSQEWPGCLLDASSSSYFNLSFSNTSLPPLLIPPVHPFPQTLPRGGPRVGHNRAGLVSLWERSLPCPISLRSQEDAGTGKGGLSVSTHQSRALTMKTRVSAMFQTSCLAQRIPWRAKRSFPCSSRD